MPFWKTFTQNHKIGPPLLPCSLQPIAEDGSVIFGGRFDQLWGSLFARERKSGLPRVYKQYLFPAVPYVSFPRPVKTLGTVCGLLRPLVSSRHSARAAKRLDNSLYLKPKPLRPSVQLTASPALVFDSFLCFGAAAGIRTP